MRQCQPYLARIPRHLTQSMVTLAEHYVNHSNVASLAPCETASDDLWCITSAATMHCMSTIKPRITITLEPVTALQLKRISELTGNSQSSMVSEVLEQATPVFERLIKILEAAEAAKQSAEAAQQSLMIQSVGHLELAQRRVERQLGLLLDDFDESSAPLLAELEEVKRRGAGSRSRTATGRQRAGAVAGGSGAVSTPLSNRGVRSTQKLVKKIAQNDGPVRVSKANSGAKKPEVS